MPLEIERRFLLPKAPAHNHPDRLDHTAWLRQGYLVVSPEGALRIREEEGACTLTAKGQGELAHEECELPIESADMSALLFRLAVGTPVEKIRHSYIGATYEYVIDVFEAHLKGLVMMEIEFPSEEAAHAYVLPAWASGAVEVTGNIAYTNAYLSQKGLPQRIKPDA